MTAAARVHVHFTDRLWGPDPAAAAPALEYFAAGRALTVTLHDLPQASDGARNLERRAACYRLVVAASAGVVVNSRHEAALLRRFVDPEALATVIPLPVDTPRVPAEWPAPAAGARPDGAPTVSVLGFVYPGKGHARVISATAYLTRRPRPVVEALGRASDGHDGDLDLLRARAHRAGIGFELTGYLPDAELLERCRRASVPVIAHEHVSASGSLTTWLGAGRRPIVLRSPYMEEMAQLHRGALTLVEPQWLPGAIERALEHPESTWLGADGAPDPSTLGPGTAEVAELYRRFWEEVAW